MVVFFDKTPEKVALKTKIISFVSSISLCSPGPFLTNFFIIDCLFVSGKINLVSVSINKLQAKLSSSVYYRK